jgi:hypothetical protein
VRAVSSWLSLPAECLRRGDAGSLNSLQRRHAPRDHVTNCSSCPHSDRRRRRCRRSFNLRDREYRSLDRRRESPVIAMFAVRSDRIARRHDARPADEPCSMPCFSATSLTLAEPTFADGRTAVVAALTGISARLPAACWGRWWPGIKKLFQRARIGHSNHAQKGHHILRGPAHSETYILEACADH